MKQILFVCIGTNVGGIEKSLINTLRSIDLTKNQVDLLLWEEPGELYGLIPDGINIINRGKIDIVEKKFLKEYSIVDKIRIIRRYIYKKILTNTNGKAWLSAKKINKQYDVAIAFSQNDYSGEFIIDRVKAIKKILWFHHGIYDLSGKKDKFNKQYYPLFDKIVAVSEDCKNQLERVFPSIKDNIIVIYNKVENEEIVKKSKFEVQSVGLYKYKIVTVSRIAYEKGIDIAVDVAKRLKDAGVLFDWIFVGKGTMDKEIQSKIVEYGLESHCWLIGAKENPYPYMKMADLYVQPSRVEAFGLTVCEARILGKKIIASNLLEINKQLNNYSKAVLVNCRSEEFYEAIKKEYLEYCEVNEGK